MRDDPADWQALQTGGSPAGFDFSPLARFDPASIPVVHRQISGLISVTAGRRPLVETLGESCGEPECRYRAHPLALHPDSRALLEGYVLAARESGLGPGVVIAGLERDVYAVRSRGAVRIADLSRHPILYRVPLSFARLRSQPAESLEWELVRIIRDRHGTGALRLPLLRGAGEDLIVHSDLAAQLEIRTAGTLQEVVPIVSRHEPVGALARLLAGLYRRR